MGVKLHSFGEVPEKGAHGPGTCYVFHCPGCECGHPVTVGVNGWVWNGSMDKPTFTPSLLCNQNEPNRCHSFITGGNIQFLSDCFHPLAGKTVEIPDWDSKEFI